jgi:hypothetical protein
MTRVSPIFAAHLSLLALLFCAVGCAGSSSGGSPNPGGAGSAANSGGAGQIATGGSSGASGDAGASGGSAGATGTAGGQVIGDAGADAGGAGTSGAAGAAGTAGTTGGAGSGSCTVKVSLTPKGQSSALIAGPSAVGELTASVAGYSGTARWTWIVELVTSAPTASDAGGELDVMATTTSDTGSTAEIPLQMPGTIEVQALIEGAPMCNRPTPFSFQVLAPPTPSYVFRVTPPSGSRLPTSERVLLASAVDGAHTIDLGAGSANDVVVLSPVDERGFPLPSFVRLTSPSVTFDLEAYTGTAAFIVPLAPDLTYDALVVPDGAVAPLRVTGDPVTLQMMLGPTATVSPGLAVTGTALDANGKPVVGARVLLRNGEVPSTVGVTGVDGQFSLSARDGTLSAEIVPPDGSGLPTAEVPAGIVLLAQEMDLALTMTWSALSAGNLSVTVRAGAGGAPVVGARVRADLAGDFVSVGTLTVEAPGGLSDAQLTASGSAEADGVTDAQGVAHLGLLPTGSYRVTVAPPDGSSSAVTMSDVILPATGLAAEVPLASLVSLTGTIAPVGATTGATVTALDQGLLAASVSPSATVGPDGTYALTLCPGRTYELLVEPSAGKMLGTSVVTVVTPGASGGSFDVTMPAGVAWSGSVTGAGRPVAGALVQVFCAAPACIDGSIAVAQGTTRADGSLSLVLPTLPSH